MIQRLKKDDPLLDMCQGKSLVQVQIVSVQGKTQIPILWAFTYQRRDAVKLFEWTTVAEKSHYFIKECMI